MFMSVLATGALAGPPISGAINEATGNFKATGIYAGECAVKKPFALIVLTRILPRYCGVYFGRSNVARPMFGVGSLLGKILRIHPPLSHFFCISFVCVLCCNYVFLTPRLFLGSDNTFHQITILAHYYQTCDPLIESSCH